MPDTCPYCLGARSLVFGQVFCSNHHRSMRRLESGTLFIRGPYLEETAPHFSRLSIRLNLTGEQYYRVGARECVVTPRSFLVINEGQEYRTAIRRRPGPDPEMIMVGFRPGLAEEVSRTLTSPAAKLLDDPLASSDAPVQFFEQTYPQDEAIAACFRRLRRWMNEPADYLRAQDLQEVYGRLLERLFFLTGRIRQDIGALPQQQPAVREEIHRRLTLARDYLDACYQQPLTVEDAARVACLSTHHFKRLFKQYFHISPHQYLVRRRLERVREMLRRSALPVREVALEAGFENASSFIRLFREYFGCTPGEYRRLRSAVCRLP